MIFKRSGLSYGRSEAPVTPYQKAAQVWDERLGSARVQARNWRFMAFGALGLAIGLSFQIAVLSTTSRVTPYVVEVERDGGVRAVAPATLSYEPSDAQIAAELESHDFLQLQLLLGEDGQSVVEVRKQRSIS